MSYNPNLTQSPPSIVNDVAALKFAHQMAKSDDRFTAAHMGVYMTLADKNNSARWSAEFQATTSEMIGLTGMSRPTYYKFVAELEEMSMIKRTHTSKNQSQASWYTLLTPAFVDFALGRYNKSKEGRQSPVTPEDIFRRDAQGRGYLLKFKTI